MDVSKEEGTVYKRPLAVVSVFFIIGILSGRFLPEDIPIFYIFVITLIFISLTSLTVVLFRDTKKAHIFLFLSIVSLGSLLYINSNIFPPEHIGSFLKGDKLRAEIIGTIKGPAEARVVYYGKFTSSYIFEIEELRRLNNRYKASGLALIRIRTERDYRYGDRLLVKGVLKRPLESRIVKKGDGSWQGNLTRNFNYRQYLENQNIFGIIDTSEKDIVLLSHNYKTNIFLRYAYFLREELKRQFLKKMPLETGAFMRAILLGDRSELPKKLNESFRNSGTMHILAISGLNVSLIAIAIMYLFRFLRINRETYYAITILFLIFLAILTGGSPSVVRATIMTIVFLIGLLVGRGVDIYNSLGAAAFFILAKNPKDIFSVGFQLSFIAVISMVYLAPRLMRFIEGDANIYLKRYIYGPLTVSISASLGTAPLILYYFKMISPISIIANIFIVPLMFVILIGGMCFSILYWVPNLGDFLADISNILVQIVFAITDFFSNIKFGHFYF